MQTAMQLVTAPLSRQQRPLSSKLATPAGLSPLGRKGAVRRTVAARAMLEDALGGFADSAPSALDSLAAHLSTRLFLLGDAVEQLAAAADGAAAAPAAAAEAVKAAADAAAAAAPAAEEAAKAAKNSGFFGAFAGAFESFLKVLDDGLEKVGVPYSYGFAIILLTILVKVATYPLTKKQVESTLSMQALQPKVKELQAKYANDPERLQVETAKMYQTAGVNPLAGCLPSLATIPVFIGLYRALSNVADEGLLSDGFFWIPSLAGPTTVNGGLGWLFSWENGAPQLGWQDTGAYLVLPILLIVSQYVSQKVISPQQSNDPSQQSAQAILKFLPLMIGYFSLNVPSGLTLYWFTNNLITTAQQLYLRRSFTDAQPAAAGAGSASTAVIDVEPVEKKPSGKELNARRSQKQQETSPPAAPGNSRGEKFRAIKAREAAAKAAAQAGAAAAPAAPAPTAAAPERGAKFRALKEREAADKAAKAGAQAGSSNGAAAAAAAEAAQPEPSSSAVAVVEAEVVEAEVVEAEAEAPAAPHQEQQQQHEQAPAPSPASSSSSNNARGKGGKKKGGKKK
ncbi:hypothetical protein ABPG75_003319 [Micractinium tetrahymenae]